MKITKFEHSCLLVEMPAPMDRTMLFDPGAMSTEARQQFYDTFEVLFNKSDITFLKIETGVPVTIDV